MREFSFLVSNYFAFLGITTLMAGMQCSLWLQLFGNSPGPNLWIPSLVFWGLYRRTEEGILMVYLLTIFLFALTSLHLSLFLICNMALFAGLLFVRQRIYTSGTLYFMLLCGGVSFGFHLIYFICSWIFEPNPITSPAWFHWFLEPLLTILVSLPLVRVFHWIDRVTHKSLPKEMEAVGNDN